MQKSTLLYAALLLAGTVLAPRALRSQVLNPSDIPPAVVRGLDAYKREGEKAAVRAWLAGSPAGKDTTNLPQVIEGLESVAKAYGKMSGYDVLRVMQIGSHVRRAYVVILFETGALYALFECYQAPSGWIVSSFLTNLRAAEILPADLVGGPR